MGTAESVFLAFCIVAAGVIAILVAIAQTPRLGAIDQHEVTHRGYAIRRWWFRMVLACAALAFAVTIPFFPYPKAGAAPVAATYQVDAQQYGFSLPATVPLGKMVEFDVTSRDVNHGFGVYDPQGRLVGQVQAMPHYVNHLRMTFTKPGTYTVRCLEYCGIGHAYMHATFEVK